jgi:hypothetical protein
MEPSPFFHVEAAMVNNFELVNVFILRFRRQSGPSGFRLKIDERMELLRSQIHEDSISGDMFEKRLEAALMQ